MKLLLLIVFLSLIAAPLASYASCCCTETGSMNMSKDCCKTMVCKTCSPANYKSTRFIFAPPIKEEFKLTDAAQVLSLSSSVQDPPPKHLS